MSEIRPLVVVLVVYLLASSPRPLAKDRSWVEIKGSHFTVASDAGEKAARAALWQLEQFRFAMKTLLPWAKLDLDRPVFALAARDEDAMRALAPASWEQKSPSRPISLFVSGVDRHFIALRSDITPSDASTMNPYQSAYWLYVSLVLRSSMNSGLPLWFSLGLTDVMSNTIVRDSSIEVGRVMPSHVERLRNGHVIPIRELLTIDRESPWYRDIDKRLDLDANVWALVHYLMCADRGAHRDQLDRFAALLLADTTPATAAELAFGDVDALGIGLARYIAGASMTSSSLKFDESLDADGLTVRSMTVAESTTAQAAFQAAMTRPREARSLLELARRADAQSPGVHDVDGVLLERDGRTEEARAEFAKAVELGSSNFYSYYRWASLTRGHDETADDDTARLDRALDRAIRLNDRFAPAYGLLAEVRLGLGRRQDALMLALRGVSLQPAAAANRFSLARVLWGMPRRLEALEQAREGLRLAASDGERTYARQLVAFYEKNQTVQERIDEPDSLNLRRALADPVVGDRVGPGRYSVRQDRVQDR